MAQPSQPQHPQGGVDASRRMDSVPGTHCTREQVGLDDQDASRAYRQLNKEPLELNNEKEEHRTHGHPLR